MALGEQEAVTVLGLGVGRGDPQHPVVQHPEGVQGGGGGGAVLLVAGHQAHQGWQVLEAALGRGFGARVRRHDHDGAT